MEAVPEPVRPVRFARRLIDLHRRKRLAAPYCAKDGYGTLVIQLGSMLRWGDGRERHDDRGYVIALIRRGARTNAQRSSRSCSSS